MCNATPTSTGATAFFHPAHLLVLYQDRYDKWGFQVSA